MTAIPLALILVATLAVLVAATPGAFSFDRWPGAPESTPSEREVVVDVPVTVHDAPRADARPRPAVERGESRVLAEAPQRDGVPAGAAPPAVPSAPSEHSGPVADGDGSTSAPVADETSPEPVPVPLPVEPEMPAKDLPIGPDPSAPEWGDATLARMRALRDDQE